MCLLWRAERNTTAEESAMKAMIDRKQFGPWALITGASSGIGREFARQIAASGVNVVLVARREALLEEAGAEFTKDFGVEHRIIAADLSEEGFIKKLASITDDLDIGLAVSNAGTGNPGKFLTRDRDEMAALLRLNALAHLDIAYHFCARFARRGRGGILFVGSMGADKGVPYMANDAAAKAYVQSFAEALHVELKPLGVHVTVLPAALTETPVLAKLGLTPETMPMKPMKVERCVSEGLKALRDNRSLIIPGRTNRILNALVPASVTRSMMAKMFEKTFADRAELAKT
jgi:short-subunit dehydrogenase